MALMRRQLLVNSAIGAGVVAAGNLGSLLAASPAAAAPAGSLVADPAGILDLPRGFRYSIVSRAGDPMPRGGATPGRHDGTTADSRKSRACGRQAGTYQARARKESAGGTGQKEKTQLKKRRQLPAFFMDGTGDVIQGPVAGCRLPVAGVRG